MECNKPFIPKYSYQKLCSKACADISRKSYWRRNKERISANPINKERMHKWYIKHRDVINEKKRVYNLENKDKIRLQRHTYYLKNAEKIKKAVKSWRIKNLQSIREKSRRKLYIKYYSNLEYKIKVLLRGRISMAMRSHAKKGHSLDLLGCSVDTLKTHIESQFKPGMTWKNYGLRGWHIDHIIPCSAFDLTKLEDQKRCFHYTNLQPLWWDENLQKSNKILVTTNG